MAVHVPLEDCETSAYICECSVTLATGGLELIPQSRPPNASLHFPFNSEEPQLNVSRAVFGNQSEQS